MTVRLTSLDVEAISALQQALLSSPGAADVDAWCQCVLRRAEALFRADRSLMLVTAGGRCHYVSDTLDREALSAAERRIAGLKPEALRSADAMEDRAWNARRVRNSEVFSLTSACLLVGVAAERLPECEEAMREIGVACGVAARAHVAAGEVLLGVGWSERARAPFTTDAAVELMRVAFPAFKAGAWALAARANPQPDVAHVLDALGESLLVCDSRGHELHRSKRLDDILSADPEREFVLGEMRALGHSLTPRLAHDRGHPRWPVGTLEVVTAAARYRVRGAFAGEGLVGHETSVLVALERADRGLPTAQQLAAYHGLTPREAEVALLLARGLSNREIADRLSLSLSTVRHHAEWVFTKLSVHSRKALGLRLMGRRGEVGSVGEA